VINDQEAILSGAAVFDSQDQKMIGTLNGKETLGLNFITGEAESAVLEFYMKDQYFAVEVKEVKSKMTADVLADRKMKCTIQINAEVNIGETNGNLNVLNPKILAEVEKKTEEDIERLINQVIEKVQKEYKADVIGVGDTLREQHYRKWETVKENWDKGENYFSQSEIVVKVNFTIREIGASLETVQ